MLKPADLDGISDCKNTHLHYFFFYYVQADSFVGYFFVCPALHATVNVGVTPVGQDKLNSPPMHVTY